MKIKKYFVIPLLAFLATSCQDKEQANIQPATGDEVKFGASLEQNATTRTIYGEEDKVNNAFPIYWVNGDKVLVYSPQCVPVTNAIYRVSAGENQNYATSLDKTGENGLQWGESLTADFYSVYPAVNVGDENPSGAEIGSGNEVVLTMPTQQDNGYVRSADGTLTVQPDMRACFMVAQNEGVESGNTVDLKYIPLSTAVRFTLQGPEPGKEPVGINYVRFYAPEGTNINGTFKADFSSLDQNGLPKLTAIEGRNYVTFNVADEHGTYLTLESGEEIELNAFLLLERGTTITPSWYIEVGTTVGRSFKKYLDDDNTDVTLVPGKIHRLKGTLPPLTPEAWDPANWMANLQRNVYLSEISIPGAWYSMDEAYQPDANNITSLYQKGIRAFHLDTRWRASRPLLLGWKIEDLGVVDDDAHTIYRDGTGAVSDEKYLSTDAPTFESVLDQIVSSDNLKEDEYMVVICTFAQGSGNYEYESGKVWIHKISEICNQEKYNDKVIEASKLNANSTVADVLGRVIVIVNTYTKTPVNDSKCFFMDIPISQSSDVFTSGNYYKVPLKYNNQDASSGITIYGTHAQRTNEDNDGSESNDEEGYIPTLSQRKSMAGEILDESKANYDASGKGKHDIWMYLGMGGYIRRAIGGDDYTTVRDELNKFIGDRIETMYSSNSFYPIGIVLMNDIASSNTSAGYVLAQRILEMNNMYRKAYDPNRSPVDGKPINGSEGNSVQSVAPGYSSGMKDNGTNAIGWTRVR